MEGSKSIPAEAGEKWESMQVRVAALLALTAMLSAGCGVSVSVQGPSPTSTPSGNSTPSTSNNQSHPSGNSPSTSNNQSSNQSPSTSPQTTIPSAIPGNPPPVPGYLGINMTDAPSDWTVQGCEVVHAVPGSPAANAGMVGSQDRTDPVGDVITGITVNGSTVQVPDCSALHNTLADTRPGDQATIYYQHRAVSLLLGEWKPEQVMLYLAQPPCPPAITGEMTSSATGNRIPLQIDLVGPSQTVSFNAILDTGAAQTVFPDSVLRQAGFTPFTSSSIGGVVPGAEAPANAYKVPANDIEVFDNGDDEYVPLGYGTLLVWGVTGSGASVDSLIGPDVLRLGASLSTQGSSWTLTPPCP